MQGYTAVPRDMSRAWHQLTEYGVDDPSSSVQVLDKNVFERGVPHGRTSQVTRHSEHDLQINGRKFISIQFHSP